ncbi:MAG TPA: chemotaxis protein CheB [Nevskiaceae bacterium]
MTTQDSSGDRASAPADRSGPAGAGGPRDPSAPPAASDDPTTQATARRALRVVGIGASAGGLKAAGSFLEHVPAASGMAFVLVFHLDPAHKSEAAELLQLRTTMPIAQITDGMPVAADHVYVIPPSHGLELKGGVLRLTALRHADGHPTVIDHFFRSLAADAGERSIGVVLSGTGSEGSEGLKAIKEAGGLAAAQDEREADYPGMPHAAAATGLVDYVLPVAGIPSRLVAASRFRVDFDLPAEAQGGGLHDGEALQKILVQLRTQVGHDFSQYKRNTVLRRIARRMQVHQVDSPSAYLELLRGTPAETEALFRELLISVTNFFRDPEVMTVLAHEVIAKLCAHAERGGLRVWVPGCATGEEAYTLAMLLHEACDGLASPPRVQVFATDVDERALEVARHGMYAESIATDVSTARLDRFFERHGGGFVVKDFLREMILFTRHDLLRDPPFSRLDLISCRNVLIYLKADIQTRIFALFHFALRPQGYLFLGGSESVGTATNLFAELDHKAKLYQARRVPHVDVRFPLAPGDPREIARAREPEQPDQRFEDLARAELLARYAPPCVIVDRNYDVAYISGRVGRYLEPGSGEANYNVLAMAREGLRVELRTALYRALHGGGATEGKHVRVPGNGHPLVVGLTVRPLPATDGYALVVFEPVAAGEAPPQPARTAHDDGVIAQLEHELGETRESLQTSSEELETSNEELRASNEELQSMNEEMQSTGEELETGKEELQSANEELLALNQELQAKDDELGRTNGDLANFIASTGIATLFLDEQLRVRRYTPRVLEIFNLIPGDIGRPFAHLTHNLQDAELVADVERVMRDLAPLERELEGREGQRWLIRLRPYRSVDNRISGVVLTFVDVTAMRRAEIAMRLSEERFRALVTTTSNVVYRMSPDWREMRSLSGGGFLADTTKANAKWIEDYIPADERPRVRAAIDAAIRNKGTFQLEHRVRRADGSVGWTASRAAPLLDADGNILEWFGAATDITDRKQAEEHEKLLVHELNHRVKNTLSTVQAIARQTRRGASDLDDFQKTFAARLLALSKTHELLARERWVGADLRAVVDTELEPYRRRGVARVEIAGEAVRLQVASALALGMALHELATNAVKYGALSVPSGRLAVQWELRSGGDGSSVRLQWVERDGPRVAAPIKHGFGYRLMTDGLADELGGSVTLDFRPSGLVASIVFPQVVPPAPADV